MEECCSTIAQIAQHGLVKKGVSEEYSYFFNNDDGGTSLIEYGQLGLRIRPLGAS